MKILIVSDTHRKNDLYVSLVQQLAPLDMVIHCGDVEGAELLIQKVADCPVHMVAGNNDFFSPLPREDIFEIEGINIWLTHGHDYYVSMDNETLKDEARSRGVDIVMYGHTHRPIIDYDGDIVAVNPGSLTYPRQEGREPSYIIMNIDENGKFDFNINFL